MTDYGGGGEGLGTVRGDQTRERERRVRKIRALTKRYRQQLVTSMSESKYEFATSILTTKTPAQAAAILPHVLGASQNLVQAKLITWFLQYTQEVQRHNHELGRLLNDGAAILGFTQPNQPNHPLLLLRAKLTAQTPDDLGSFNKVWNTFLRLIELEVHSNEQFHRNLKLETLNPLKEFINNDVRYSELVINSQELQEIARDLGKSHTNSEYQWNVKAPQVFDNLENFEKVKSQLLYDVILNYFNATNTRYSKIVANSENLVNYLLGTYKLDDEMSHYLQYLLKSDFTSELAAAAPSMATPAAAPPHSKRLSSFGARSSHSGAGHDAQSAHLGSATTPKKASKLKSKVGSIFGRKHRKSPSKLDHSDAIPEDSSVTSSVVHGSNRSVDSLGNLLSSRRNSELQTQSVGPSQISPRKHQELPPAPVESSSPPQAAHPTDNRVTGVATGAAVGVAAVGAAPAISASSAPLTPTALHPLAHTQAANSPNIVRYDSSSSTSSSETSVSGVQQGIGGTTEGNKKRLSMLQSHNLDTPSTSHAAAVPQIATELQPENNLPHPSLDLHIPPKTNDRLSQTTSGSVGKYSFEAGDDEKPISATPKETQRDVFGDSEATDAPVNGLVGASSSASLSGHAANGTAPPPPPPSRKVHTTTHDFHTTIDSSQAPPSILDSSRNRRDVKSHYFHNLPLARESFAAAPRSLVSQDTGNSIMQHLNGSGGDLFKHSGENNQIGLNASIAEVVNASFKDDRVVRKQLIGEIAFNFHPDPNHTENPDQLQSLQITIPTAFDKVLLNNHYVSRVSGYDEQYIIDAEKIRSRTLGGLKYLKSLDAVPILIHQAWKFEPHQASVLINLKLNPQYASSVVLNDVVVSCALSADLVSTSASSKPSGTFNRDLNRITWRYSKPLALTSERGESLAARFMTNGEGKEHESGIQLKFSLSDPPTTTEVFLNGVSVPSVRSLVSGSYSGHN